MSGDFLPLAQAAKQLPGHPSTSTLRRWRREGVAGTKLQCLRVGGRWFVSIAALEEFVAATDAALKERRGG